MAMSEYADSRETLTFVVRLWRESNASGQDHWRGRVEHIASQEVAYVEDAAGVAGFIARWTGEPPTARTAATGGCAYRNSIS
jgi:hypothetical protein